MHFLNDKCITVDLLSRVSGKTYFSYAKRSTPNSLSRPINRALYNFNEQAISKQWRKWIRPGAANAELASLLYTMAIAYGAASDLFDRNNKKGPATYFELLIGHLFARELGVNPTKQVSLPVSGKPVRMTMDFLFKLGEGQPQVHLPVKISTRERVVQAWAHQRILDAAYGHAKFRGILVVFSETKLSSTARDVVEICVPDQWLAYQTFLAKMDRIYYFDMPFRYATLSRQFPVIRLKRFDEFFAEKEVVLSAPLV